LFAAGGNMVFSFHQNGNQLTGTVEGAGGVFADGNRPPLAIEEGKIDGEKISFKAGTSSFSGSLSGDQIEIVQNTPRPLGMLSPPSETPAGEGVAIGPPPDETDPSRNAALFRPPAPFLLHRTQR
jgi:beta-galactosidase